MMMADRVRVLVADDENHIRRFLRECLEDRGYEVAEAHDGEEALRLLTTDTPPALVIADLAMPRMDGLMLMDRMRESERLATTPVIVLWVRVSQDEDELIAWRDAHVKHWLMKPVAKDALLMAVEEALCIHAVE
jgi:CheY-like chemotaxis protein